jgi:small-conductance mechanosensitive channel
MTRGDLPLVQGEDIRGAPKRTAHRRVVMKKNVRKYGLLSGLALAIMMALTVPFEHHIGARYGMAIGYTIMVLSFLIVFVGVKHYRDTECGGSISFGRALAAGMLMMLISCFCYVAMWEVLTATVEKNFAHDYTASMVKRAQSSGLQGAALEAKIAEAHKFEVMYSNPLYRMAMTLLEPLPVGIVMALVTAGILRRKPQDVMPRAASPEALVS